MEPTGTTGSQDLGQAADLEAFVCRLGDKLRASEEQFRVAVESAPINIAIYSHDMRLLYVNPPLAAMCPRPPSEILGKRADEIWPADLVEPLKRRAARAIATGERQNYELESAPPGSRRMIKQWTLVPLPAAAGEMPQILVMSHDITAERELVEELRESNRRKSEFIGVLSHELRNPLAAIRTSLYVLLARAPAADDAGGRAVRVIDRQVEQLVRMVDDLLDVTRITQNKIQLQRKPIDLSEVVRQTIEDYRPTLEHGGVQLAAEFAAGPIRVSADSARIAQVVTNLLANAVKFTPRGGRVTVFLSIDQAGEHAVLRVTDTGTGIDPALLGRVFEPFTQADRTLDRTGGGLGLGLALVKGLVELHQGDVKAHSEGLGRGTELTVRLPLARVDVDTAGPPPRDGAVESALRVLIIEDDADVAEGLKGTLEMDAHQVTVARSGAEGLERARTSRPDVVLCDIGLPGMNGYDVAQAFRADSALRSTYLVALSGYAQADDVDRARAAGFDQHLAKPPRIERLKRLLAAGNSHSAHSADDPS
jgi:PAS domain S-box-containing protein